jgi:ribosomal protein S18 acetylase RimI-like enzyme
MVDDAPDVRLSSEPGASREDIDGIVDRIDAWNMAVTGVQEFHQVAIFLRDATGAIRGGVTGGVWGGWLHVIGLWVDEPLRGRGLGNQLIHAAEGEARAAGAHGAFLETHWFQAPAFYRKLGYETIAEIEDYPPGGSQLVMRKSLR